MAMAPSRQKHRTSIGQEMAIAEDGETQWCFPFLGLCQSSVSRTLPLSLPSSLLYQQQSTLWGFLFSSLTSLFILLSLDCQSSGLIWSLSHFLQGVKFRMALSAKEPQARLQRVRKSIQLQQQLENKNPFSMNHIFQDASIEHKT